MALELILGVAGLILLTLGADHLVLGSSRVAARLRLSPVVVGVVVIGLGTSAPEFLVSGVAAATGTPGIAVGNIVGSNILNLTFVLGMAALVAPVAVASTVVRREVPLAVGAVALFAIASLAGLTAPVGIALLAVLAGALVLLIRWAKAGPDPELADEVEEFTTPARPTRMAYEIPRALAGLAGVLIGANLIVDNASSLASRFGVSDLVIGVTVVAIGTSLPELVTTIQAQRRGETDLVVGNLFGSNLFNSLAGGAVIGLASGSDAAAPEHALLGVMLLVALLAWALLRRGLRLTRPEGLILIVAYAATLPLLL
ncbi:MAG: calcium/sodium antiporter [Hamadaea sp.]|nr:calcium/sodium antiporter [Hamadaea sp.]